MRRIRTEEIRIETREAVTGLGRRRTLEGSNTRTSGETRRKTEKMIDVVAHLEATETAHRPRVAEIVTATVTAIPEPPPARSLRNPSQATRIPLSPPSDQQPYLQAVVKR